MSAHRFVLVDSAAPYNPSPSARKRFAWLRPVEHGKRDAALASHVCNCIFTTTEKLVFKGVRVKLIPAHTP